MDMTRYLKIDGEKPLDNIAINGGYCSILRKIVCIGDSLSSGEFESCRNGKVGYHDSYDYSWGQFLARDAGCTVLNCSKGGMTAEKYDQFASERGYYNDEYKANAYIIALGVNDVSRVMDGTYELGEISDVDAIDYNNNKPTVIGYYARIIAKYKMLQPKAKFFLMTMPKRGKDDEREMLYEKHQTLLHKLAKIFDNCYVIDLREYAPVYDQEFKKNFFLGGHMNPMGYRLTALMVESYIDYIIRNNFDDFKQVGFIGTPDYNENEKW